MFKSLAATGIFTSSVIFKGIANTYYYYTRAASNSTAEVIESVSQETAESLKKVAKADANNYEEYIGNTIILFESCNNLLVTTPLYKMKGIDLPVSVKNAMLPMYPVKELISYSTLTTPITDFNESTFLKLFGNSVTVQDIHINKVPHVINKLIDEVPKVRYQAMLRAKTCWLEDGFDQGNRQWESDIMSGSSIGRLHPSAKLRVEPQQVKLKDIAIPQGVEGDTNRIRDLGLKGAKHQALKDILVKEIRSAYAPKPNKELLAAHPLDIESEFVNESLKEVSNFIAYIMAIEGSTSMLFTITKGLFEIWAFSRKYKLSMGEVISPSKKGIVEKSKWY